MIAQGRVYSVDILRGIVIVLMALGHSRHFFLLYDFAPTNLTHSFPAFFFTRWITNICAPVFVFLAGVSIYLAISRKGNPGAISLLLIKRGLWLIFLEIGVLTFFWHTHFDVIQLQVIWIIGVSFLFMSFLIYLPWGLNLGVSIMVIAFHNIMDIIDLEYISDCYRIMLTFLHIPGSIDIQNVIKIDVLYSFLPYIGIMLLGYSMGRIFDLETQLRKRILLVSGSVMLVLFFILRGFNFYGDPDLWSVQENGTPYSIMSFLNVTKYPPSLQFVLSTLGPAFIILPLLENKMNTGLAHLGKLGQVAMFFYLIHIPFIRTIAKAYYLFFDTNPSFLGFYIIWIVMIATLYFFSMKFRSFKASKVSISGYWWLKYF